MKVAYISLFIIVVFIMLSAALSKIVWPSCGVPFCFVDVLGLIRNVIVPIVEIGIVIGLCVPQLHRVAVVAVIGMASAFMGFLFMNMATLSEVGCGCYGSVVFLSKTAEGGIITSLLFSAIAMWQVFRSEHR